MGRAAGVRSSLTTQTTQRGVKIRNKDAEPVESEGLTEDT
jgi:hypothetical protein